MIGRGLLQTTLLVLTIPGGSAAMAFGPGEAGGGSRRETAAVDFKVAFWYRRDDALGTFKYQIYDLRKGQYTPAVDAWVEVMSTKYPAYIVSIRDVDLKREKGETEMLKVGAVIKRELIGAAAMSGIIIGGGLRTMPGANDAGPSQASRVNRSPALPQVDRSFLNPSSTPFPVPVPYPRPHP